MFVKLNQKAQQRSHLKLSQAGLTSIMVWVLEDNPAVQFYQALGGQKIGQKLLKIGDNK